MPSGFRGDVDWWELLLSRPGVVRLSACVVGQSVARATVAVVVVVIVRQVFAVKTWGELASYDDYGGSVTGVKFAPNATFLVRDADEECL